MKLFTLLKNHEFTEEIKKSRFVARAFPVRSAVEATHLLEQAKDVAASHNCFAYRAGLEYRFSDDGEPGGTAGRPILSAMEGRDVDYTLVLVTRYFGGIKLGAGGLVRAYGGTAAKCLNQAEMIEIRPKVVVTVNAAFESTGAIHNLIVQFGGVKKDEKHNERGLVLSIELEAASLEEFRRELADATRGRARVMFG